MKRRKFIKIFAALSLTSIAAYFVFPSFSKTIENILSRDTSNLKISNESIPKFMDEASREGFWNRFSTSKKIILLVHANARILNRILPYYDKYLQYRNSITGQFLLSTDFFSNKIDVNLNVSYVQFYNPYKQPCSNPFSSIYYPGTV